ncbi:MAG: methyltransferase domain-containing protein [Thermoplasmata archaeon]
MSDPRSVTATFEVPLPPAVAFEAVLGELRDALALGGEMVELGPQGRIARRGTTVGRVTAWEPDRRLVLEWHPTTWMHDERTSVELRFDVISIGTRITCEVRGWGTLLGEDPRDLAGWFSHRTVAPLFRAVSPEGLGDWLTDRRVRRPAGPVARETYANPTFHWPNFLLILDRIALRPEDRLLEVGCGGGAFLHKALESGCRATAVDHSPEMVRLAIEQNREAVASGAVTILEGEASQLPVPDGAFTCAVMTGVIGFLPDPGAALKEIHRALGPGGRVAIYAATAALRGTPAAPEPFASRIRFFERAELEAIGREAGFVDVRVDEPSLEPYARSANLPAPVVEFFRGDTGALLLTARKA